MAQNFLRLSGFTRDERHALISRVRDAFAACDASILDFKMFSNLSLSIFFELPARRVVELANALSAAGVRLSAESRDLIADYGQRRETKDWQPAETGGALQITFIHQDPDLRLEVPPIPG